MKLEEEKKRQSELEDIIKVLSKIMYDDSNLEMYAEELCRIYQNGFRHKYSQFFPIILEINDETNEYDLEWLMYNLERIQQLVEEDYFSNINSEQKKYKGLYKNLTKLVDHINLEIARYNQERVHENSLLDITVKTEELTKAMEDTKTEFIEARKEIKDQQKEYITILGIFAAIILTFTGGMAYSTSVLENISSVSIYRVVVIACIIGIVLVSSIYLLFRFIHNIVAENEQKKKGFFSQHPLFNLLAINSIFLVILAVTVVIWLFGGVEKRNLRIVEAYQIEEQGE